MKTKIVYQIDRAGLLLGEALADESPREPDVWIMPAGTVAPPPPATWPDDLWPRWNGSAWVLTGRPRTPNLGAPPDPVAKLQEFLASNPDVAALLNPPSSTASTPAEA